jgi:uncharacterized protein (TIGR04255 family)
MSETSHPRLPCPPLVLVVAQVRFSPIENIKDKYIPAIQEKLRASGYPYFERSPIQQFAIMGNGAQFLETDQWFFTDKLKQTNVVLTKHSLTVNTVKYDTFDKYVHKVGNAVKEVTQILELFELSVLERVSLRYVDWIYQIDGETLLEKMINDEYLGGFSNDDDVLLRQVILERKTSVGGVVRTIIFRPNNPQMVLGEFQSVRLNLPQFTQSKKDFIILDMEHSKSTQGEDFSQEYILMTLESLHSEVDRLFFEQIPSKKAHELWRKEG